MSMEYYLECDVCKLQIGVFDNHPNSFNDLFKTVRFLKVHVLNCHANKFNVLDENESVDKDGHFIFGNNASKSKHAENVKKEIEGKNYYMKDVEEVIIKSSGRTFCDYVRKNENEKNN